MASTTLESMSVGPANLSPPCTTRCPIPDNSPVWPDLTTIRPIWSSASPWSRIRSTTPPTSTLRSRMSNSWYLIEELPELTTRIFMRDQLALGSPKRQPSTKAIEDGPASLPVSTYASGGVRAACAAWRICPEGANVTTHIDESQVLRLTTEAAIRLALLAALMFACLSILWPFVLPVIWGVIIAIAVWPVFRWLTAALGKRRKLAALLFTLVALALLVIPSWLVAETVTDALISVGEKLASGDVTIPKPPDDIADWPIIGEKLAATWTQAVEDPPAAIEAFKPQIMAVGGTLLSAVAGIGIGVLQFVFSIILAGVFLATAKGGAHAADILAVRLAGPERGHELVKTATATVTSVFKGVLGVAIVQAVAATIGMLFAGVPAAPAWGLVILILAIAQMPPLLVLGPMIFYVFSTTSTFGAILFMIWALVVSVSDSFLKPLFLGRGVEVPMLVILIGAIGGMIAWGILGLFVGAVVLAVGYQLSRAWLHDPVIDPGAADETG